MTTQETGAVTGTKDKDYNLIWYVEACLGNALRLETLHPGRRPRGRLRGGRPVPQGAGGQPQGRRDGLAAAALAAGLLTDPGHRSRRKRSGAPIEITGAEPPFWMLPTAVCLGRAIADNRIICPGLRGQPGSACAAGRGGPALASAGVSRP
jgi:hypothetical protein